MAMPAPAAGRPTGTPIVQLTLEGETAAALRREARRRDMSATALALALIDTTVTDDLWAAVLDDGAPAEPPP
jgi:hypothetical protein